MYLQIHKYNTCQEACHTQCVSHTTQRHSLAHRSSFNFTCKPSSGALSQDHNNGDQLECVSHTPALEKPTLLSDPLETYSLLLPSWRWPFLVTVKKRDPVNGTRASCTTSTITHQKLRLLWLTWHSVQPCNTQTIPTLNHRDGQSVSALHST